MKKTLLVVAFVGAVVLAVGVSGYAYAQGNEPPTLPFGNGGRGGNGSQGGPDRELIETYMHDALAEALGVTAEELTALHDSGESMQTLLEEQGLTFEEFRALMDDARSVAITAAVADGAITQEQADLIQSHAQDAEGRFAGRDGDRGQGGFGEDNPLQDYMQSAMADALGLSVEELDAMCENGTGLRQYAEEQGLSQEDMQAAMQAAFSSAVDAAVADGAITQEQADQIQERGGQGGRGGRGGSHGPRSK